MMMSKPKPEAAASATASETANKNKAPHNNNNQSSVDAVADLERRLADLSSATPHIAPVEMMGFATPPPPPVLQPAAATAGATTATTTVAGAAAAATNKNALLVSSKAKEVVCALFTKDWKHLVLFFSGNTPGDDGQPRANGCGIARLSGRPRICLRTPRNQPFAPTSGKQSGDW